MVDPSDRFLKVMKGLMRPLVRTLIARGITAPAFYKLLKSVYVEVAHDDFRIGNKAPTDSRITLLTGVHRRDVRAILSSEDETWETTRSKTAMLATVIGQWRARPSYLAEDGSPKPLPRTAADGESFEALVRAINTDIRPRTVLDELLRQDLLVEGEDGLLRISDAARRGPASDDDRLVFFASNVGDHIAAAAENLLAETPPFYERAVFYNNLRPEAVDAIEARARLLSQNVLETLNEESLALRGDAEITPPGRERYRLGIYFYRETGEPETAPPREARDEDD
ncbi:MAG: DUF6502 family protein [Pseudomonadota bacterium]